MSVLYIVVPLALVFAAVAVGVFIWATRSGQFDDTETPGVRILFDDEDMRSASGDLKVERQVPSSEQ
jgi:cbb3-type cytochrome oxidase maturation protein